MFEEKDSQVVNKRIQNVIVQNIFVGYDLVLYLLASKVRYCSDVMLCAQKHFTMCPGNILNQFEQNQFVCLFII